MDYWYFACYVYRACQYAISAHLTQNSLYFFHNFSCRLIFDNLFYTYLLFSYTTNRWYNISYTILTGVHVLYFFSLAMVHNMIDVEKTFWINYQFYDYVFVYYCMYSASKLEQYVYFNVFIKTINQNTYIVFTILWTMIYDST